MQLLRTFKLLDREFPLVPSLSIRAMNFFENYEIDSIEKLKMMFEPGPLSIKCKRGAGSALIKYLMKCFPEVSESKILRKKLRTTRKSYEQTIEWLVVQIKDVQGELDHARERIRCLELQRRT